MFNSIVKILGAALSIWDSKESRKYLKKVYKLEKKYDKEYDKEYPDHNVLDHIERDMIRLSDLVAKEIKV